MVTPVLGHIQAALRVHRPPEFAAPLDDGRFEEAASLEIGQQCADGTVGLAADLGQSAGVAGVLGVTLGTFAGLSWPELPGPPEASEARVAFASSALSASSSEEVPQGRFRIATCRSSLESNSGSTER